MDPAGKRSSGEREPRDVAIVGEVSVNEGTFTEVVVVGRTNVQVTKTGVVTVDGVRVARGHHGISCQNVGCHQAGRHWIARQEWSRRGGSALCLLSMSTSPGGSKLQRKKIFDRKGRSKSKKCVQKYVQ